MKTFLNWDKPKLFRRFARIETTKLISKFVHLVETNKLISYVRYRCEWIGFVICLYDYRSTNTLFLNWFENIQDTLSELWTASFLNTSARKHNFKAWDFRILLYYPFIVDFSVFIPVPMKIKYSSQYSMKIV